MRLSVMCGLLAFSTMVSVVKGADPALIALLPAGSNIVFGANLAEARNTPFGEYVLSRMATDEKDLAALIAATGFDPRRDLVEVIGTGEAQTGNRVGFMAVRGTFEPERIAETAKAHGADVTPYRGIKIVAADNARDAFAFLDSNTAVAGQLEQVTAAIDRWRNSEKAPADVAARLSEISAGQDVWALTIGSPAQLAERVPDSTLRGAMKGEIIQAIQEMHGGIKFGPEVKISGQSVTRSNDEAVALAGVVRFFVSLAELNNRGKFAGLAKALSSKLQLSTEANRVIFSLSMPEQDFENLVEALREHPSRASTPPKDKTFAENHTSRN